MGKKISFHQLQNYTKLSPRERMWYHFKQGQEDFTCTHTATQFMDIVQSSTLIFTTTNHNNDQSKNDRINQIHTGSYPGKFCIQQLF